MANEIEKGRSSGKKLRKHAPGQGGAGVKVWVGNGIEREKLMSRKI